MSESAMNASTVVEPDAAVARAPHAVRAARPIGSGHAAPAVRARTRSWDWKWVWVGALAAYTVFTILSISQNAIYSMQQGEPVGWHFLILQRVLEEYSCALFVPALFWLVYRFPIDRRHWRRHGAILLTSSLLFVVVKYALMQPLYALFSHRAADSLATVLAANTFSVVFDFWAVIGVAHALEFYRRARDRERTAAALRAQLSRAQLEALKSQLHPHFLFNTLHGAATLMHRDVDAADTMLTQLADLLRATLRHPGTHEIPLAEELSLLDRYLAIMRVRFRDRLTVVRDVAPEVHDALVPVFLLQPLVENALEHGIAQRPGPGRLELRASRAGDQLRIAIVDDGPGIRSTAPSDSGIGLANTRARLEELYGDAQALALEPASPAGGACVVVTIPYRLRSASAEPSRRASAAIVSRRGDSIAPLDEA